MFAFLAGPLGKFAIYGVIIAGVVMAALFWLHEHDNGVRAAMQAQADKVIAAAQEANHQHEVAALEAQAADAAARAKASSDLRSKVHALPSTSACADSPAIRTLLDSLRPDANGPGAKH